MGIPLNKFIDNLKRVKSVGIPQLAKEEIAEIFGEVLKRMAEYTIVDTNQARSAIIDEFAKRYTIDVDYLYTQEYRHWETHGFPENASRGRGQADTNYNEKVDNKEFSVDISINDEGLYMQELGRHPSSKHAEATGRDNSQFRRRHITIVSNEWDTYSEVNELIVKIIEKVEKELFK